MLDSQLLSLTYCPSSSYYANSRLRMAHYMLQLLLNQFNIYVSDYNRSLLIIHTCTRCIMVPLYNYTCKQVNFSVIARLAQTAFHGVRTSRRGIQEADGFSNPRRSFRLEQTHNGMSTSKSNSPNGAPQCHGHVHAKQVPSMHRNVR